MDLRHVGILPQQCTASQSRVPRLQIEGLLKTSHSEIIVLIFYGFSIGKSQLSNIQCWKYEEESKGEIIFFY
jgi:hypothetical protein